MIKGKAADERQTKGWQMLKAVAQKGNASAKKNRSVRETPAEIIRKLFETRKLEVPKEMASLLD